MNKLVSICLLTYMHEKYIEDCLNSIINQSYPRLELIIYDDCSTDKTMQLIFKILSKRRQRFEKVTILQSRVNTGKICASVNIMLRHARGEYIKEFSGDDLMFPDCIENLVLAFDKHPDVGVVCGKPINVNEDFRLPQNISPHKLDDHKINIVPSKKLFEQLLVKNIINAPSVMIKRELFNIYGYYNENVGFEDLDMWLKLSHNKVKFEFIDCELVFYRRSESSISNYNSSLGNKKILFMFLEERKIIKSYLKYVRSDQQKKYITNLYIRYINDAKGYNLKFINFKILKLIIEDKVPIKNLFVRVYQ